MAGRKVMLDACLSALPIYYMSTLKIPISVLNQIDSIRRRFFWHGTKAEEKRMAMVGWNTITNPKLIGGLGVLDLKAMNQALLARWCWKWLSSERSLWKNLNLTLQGDRFSLFPLASTVTHALRETLPILQVATKINLSSGLTTAFWHQDWGFGIWANVFSLAFSYCLVQNATVHQFFQAIDEAQQIFNPAIYEMLQPLQQLTDLLSILQNVTLSGANDQIEWKVLSNENCFSVKNFYRIIKTLPKTKSPLNKIWKIKIPPRMLFFIWQMLQNKIATIDNLKKKRFSVNKHVPTLSSGGGIL